MENDFYNKIVYKKNAYLQLKEDLSKYYYGKNILLITSKSLSNANLTEIMNAISLSNCAFKYFVAKNNFSLQELKELSELLTSQDFDLYITFGADRVSNVAKYFSHIFCVPYFFCPSACSTISYFNDICINPYDSTRYFKCDYPERIYISEAVIKTTPRSLVKQGAFQIIALEELLAQGVIENILFDKQVNYLELEKCIKKFKKELKQIMSGDIDAKLILMDILIDVSYQLKEVNLFKTSLFNLFVILKKVFHEDGEIVGSGETFLLASKSLLLCYKNLFSQKNIKQIDLPDFPKIVKNIEKYSIFCKKINNFAFFNEILSKKELILRLNNLKEEFLYQVNKRIDEQVEVINTIKLYDSLFTYQIPQIKNIFSAIKVLPYVTDNNYIVSLIGGLGFLNSF